MEHKLLLLSHDWAVQMVVVFGILVFKQIIVRPVTENTSFSYLLKELSIKHLVVSVISTRGEVNATTFFFLDFKGMFAEL